MRILFIHNNFPGQYRRLYQYLAQFPEYELMVATLDSNSQDTPLKTLRYSSPPPQVPKQVRPAVRVTNRAVAQGHLVYMRLKEVRDSGYKPDLVLSHSGWGASLFIKDLFPDTKLLNYYEWYHHRIGPTGEKISEEQFAVMAELRMKNTPTLHDLAAQDWGQCPTEFQQSQFPEIFRKNISVIHDGVDTEFFKPDDSVSIPLNGKTFTKNDEVVTYIGRGMEDMRGFREFMEAAYRIQKSRPNVHIVIIGEDKIAYGIKKPDGKGLKQWALNRFGFDMDRLHFLGRQPLESLRDWLCISSAHVYLTAPFVLSWSMIEAMSAEALLIASDTAPVQELLKHEENALLVPLRDVDQLTEKLLEVLENPDGYASMRRAARQTVLDNYDQESLLPKHRQLLHSVMDGEIPDLA